MWPTGGQTIEVTAPEDLMAGSTAAFPGAAAGGLGVLVTGTVPSL